MNGNFRVGLWRVEPSLNTVSRNRTTVHLEPKVMEVLVCLAQHPGEPVSKETMLQAVWPGTFVSDDVLKRSIHELRRVFEDDAREPRFIQTIAKRGYRLVAPLGPVSRTGTGTVPMTGRFLRAKLFAPSAAAALALLVIFGESGLRNWRAKATEPARVETRFQNISPDVAPTRVTHAVLPEYPAFATQTHVTGTVEIGLAVSPNGEVASVRVLIGHPMLITAALEAIRQWRFQPNRVLGEVTWSRMRALVRFRADGTTSVAFAAPLLPDSFGDPGAQRDERRDASIPAIVPEDR